MNRKLITVLLVLLLVATLFSACSSDAEAVTDSEETSSVEATTDEGASDEATAEAKDLDIVWIHSGASNQSEQRAYAGFMASVEENGWTWTVSEVNSEDSGDKVANNISDAVAKGCDVIIASMADVRASAAAIQEANDANIPIFTIDSGYTDGVVVDTTSNNYVMAAKVSTYLTDIMGGEGNLCILSATGFAGGRKRGETLYAVLKECSGITVLDDHNIDLTDFYNDSANTMEDWISRFGDDIDAVWCVWDEPAMAVTNVLAAAGYSRDDVIVTGIDGNESAVQMMRDGSPIIATVAQPFEMMGATTANLIQKYVVQGISWEEAIGATTLYVEAPLITTSNIPDEGTPAYEAVDFYNKY